MTLAFEEIQTAVLTRRTSYISHSKRRLFAHRQTLKRRAGIRIRPWIVATTREHGLDRTVRILGALAAPRASCYSCTSMSNMS